MPKGPKGEKRPRDPAQLAKMIVDIARARLRIRQNRHPLIMNSDQPLLAHLVGAKEGALVPPLYLLSGAGILPDLPQVHDGKKTKISSAPSG